MTQLFRPNLGEAIITEIAKQGMFTVSHPDPANDHVFVWNSGAAEQLEAVVNNHLAPPESASADPNKIPIGVVYERALSLVMDEWGKTREEAIEWLSDNSEDWPKITAQAPADPHRIPPVIIYELEGIARGESQWVLIYSNEEKHLAQKEEREFREWVAQRPDQTSWRDFRVIESITTKRVLPPVP